MIKLERAHIEEVRGIRKLDIDFRSATFAISGPNGSGKSGVIDAIEFGLTGQIGRLAGTGTQRLSVAEHGPHVDKTRFPDAAFVELRVFLPSLNKSATITRKVSAPKRPKIVPPDAEVKALFDEIADHPEITLSRREILRFILVEPSKRSDEIQAILKLSDIGNTRSALNTAQNKLRAVQDNAAAQARSAQDALQVHFQIATLRSADLLEAANVRRRVLGLPEIAELTADTKLAVDLSASLDGPYFNKISALRDLKTLSNGAVDFSALATKELAEVIANVAALERDPELLASLQRRSLIDEGLALVDGPNCPLCDTQWPDEQRLREHLSATLAKSAAAGTIQEELLGKGAAIARDVTRLLGFIAPVQKIAESLTDESVMDLLSAWKMSLERICSSFANIEGLRGFKDPLEDDWLRVRPAVTNGLKAFTEKIEARPDQTTAFDAQTFLTTADLRLADHREATRKDTAAKIAFTSAHAAYNAYCSVIEEELNALYDDVQEDFSTYYREINEDDEAGFTAKLSPNEGKLNFDVNFYERGLFPPAAYHSEGHQDGMGVCLYLALMKRLFATNFNLALLDDVVMSVDSGHRYQFCRLLKRHFPDTQFVITTHDRLWAEQMKSAGLVTSKTSLIFHGWTIDMGPLVESNEEIWEEIGGALAKGKVEAAAVALRHHLEWVSRVLAPTCQAETVPVISKS